MFRITVKAEDQPLAVAPVAGKTQHPSTPGLEQIKLYAASDRLHVPFALDPGSVTHT